MAIDYQRRIVDDELDQLAAHLPAVALEGPKAVGKTETASRRVARMVRLDVPGSREIAEADPELVLKGELPVLLDEWQHSPRVWDAVRRAVDHGMAPGSVLLTGSAVARQLPLHSGAGRIVSVRMRPMALAERGIVQPTVSISELLTGSKKQIEGVSPLTLHDYAQEILRSGFPGMRHLSGRALRAQLDSYLAYVLERDIRDFGLETGGKRLPVLRNWLTAYAAATSTTTSLEKLRNAAGLSGAGEGSEISRPSALAYHEVLQRLWIVDPLAGWIPTRNSLRRLAQAPKLHMADPALAARLLGLDLEALLEGSVSPLAAEQSKSANIISANSESHSKSGLRFGTLFGQLFESLMALSVRVYAQRSESRVFHLRLHGGSREIDFIVERPDGRVLAIEVKLSSSVDDRDVRHLLWLREHLGEDLLDAAVVTTGTQAYRRKDGVAVIPAALLGA